MTSTRTSSTLSPPNERSEPASGRRRGLAPLLVQRSRDRSRLGASAVDGRRCRRWRANEGPNHLGLEPSASSAARLVASGRTTRRARPPLLAQEPNGRLQVHHRRHTPVRTTELPTRALGRAPTGDRVLLRAALSRKWPSLRARGSHDPTSRLRRMRARDERPKLDCHPLRPRGDGARPRKLCVTASSLLLHRRRRHVSRADWNFSRAALCATFVGWWFSVPFPPASPRPVTAPPARSSRGSSA